MGTGIGSCAATVIPAAEAERFLEGVLEERGLWESRGPLAESELTRFGELVGAAPGPSTTSAARRPTAGTRSPCWGGGPWPGPGPSTGGAG